MKQVKVIFLYDEPTTGWEVEVENVDSALEAKQCFNAVVITCRQKQLAVGLEHQATLTVRGTWEIIPAAV